MDWQRVSGKDWWERRLYEAFTLFSQKCHDMDMYQPIGPPFPPVRHTYTHTHVCIYEAERNLFVYMSSMLTVNLTRRPSLHRWQPVQYTVHSTQ